MKRGCRLLALLLLSSSVLAQPLSPGQLAQLTANPERLQGQFRQQKYLGVFDTSLTSSGRFDYQRSGQIRWQTELPVQSELIMTRAAIINRQAGQELIRMDTQSQPAAKVMSDIFFAVMASDWSLLSDYFLMQGELQAGAWVAHLTPLQADMATLIGAVELSGSQFLERVVMHEANGDRITIEFSELQATALGD